MKNFINRSKVESMSLIKVRSAEILDENGGPAGRLAVPDVEL
jgi:hypothetical protein